MGAYLGESSAMVSLRNVGSPVVVVVVVGRKKRCGNSCMLFPHLGRVRPSGPRVGYIYLSPYFIQDLMAQSARALVVVSLVLGSILVW